MRYFILLTSAKQHELERVRHKVSFQTTRKKGKNQVLPLTKETSKGTTGRFGQRGNLKVDRRLDSQ